MLWTKMGDKIKINNDNLQIKTDNNEMLIVGNMSDDEKEWVLRHIGCLTASTGEIYIKELFKNLKTETFPYQKIARQTCKLKVINLKQ